MKKTTLTILSIIALATGAVAYAKSYFEVTIFEVENQFVAENKIKLYKFTDKGVTCYGSVGTTNLQSSVNTAISCVPTVK